MRVHRQLTSTPIHGMFVRGMRRHFPSLLLCAQITFIEPQNMAGLHRFVAFPEIVALSVVYASTIFLSSFALIGAANDMMGNAIFSGYISSVCAAFAGVVGYMTFVQAEMMNAKTIASLLPFFVISGGHRRHDHRRPILVSQQLFAARRQNHVCGPYVQLHADSCRHMHHHRQLLRHLRTGDHRTATVLKMTAP